MNPVMFHNNFVVDIKSLVAIIIIAFGSLLFISLVRWDSSRLCGYACMHDDRQIDLILDLSYHN